MSPDICVAPEPPTLRHRSDQEAARSRRTVESTQDAQIVIDMLKHVKRPHHVKRTLIQHEAGIEFDNVCIRHTSSGMLQALGVQVATSGPQPTLACRDLKYVSGTTTDLNLNYSTKKTCVVPFVGAAGVIARARRV